MDPNIPVASAQNDGTQAPIPQTPPAQSVPPAVAPIHIDTATLEEELAKELGPSVPVPQTDNLENKAQKLADAGKALEAKIGSLEQDVKTKLASLKELKAAIEEEIRKIKELKVTEGKIDAELHKIQELETKRAEIENEIKTIEQTTQSL